MLSAEPMTKTDAAHLAVTWAERGVPSFPVAISLDDAKTLAKGRTATNKRPLTAHGYQDASTDPDQVIEMFREAHPKLGEELGVGLWPGRGGMVAVDLDIDPAKGISGPDAAHRLGITSDTYSVVTASGGIHRLFTKLDLGRNVANSAGALAPGIDIRGDEGFIVAPGTTTTWGTWEATADWIRPPVMDPAIWRRLSFTSTGSTVTPRGNYSPADHDDHLGPETVAMFQYLLEHHGASEKGATVLEDLETGRWELRLTRPGKATGVSATIGHIGPGVLNVFTDGWDGLSEGKYNQSQLEFQVEARDHFASTLERRLTTVTPAETQPQDDPEGLELIKFEEIDEVADALVDGLLMPGRWTAVVAKPKQGKSTLLVYISMMVSLGWDPFTGVKKGPGVSVLYLDAEMGRFDLLERLEECGIDDPATELPNWAATDMVPKLDTALGFTKVARTAIARDVKVVVIDGLNGVISGDENDATAWIKLFESTITNLKRVGIAVITADNLGKNVKQGPRGSSAKMDKADAIMRVTKASGGGLKIVSTMRRTAAFADEINLKVTNLDEAGQRLEMRHTDQLIHDTAVMEKVRELEAAQIPRDWGRLKVVQALKAAGIVPGNTRLLGAAIKLRKEADPEAMVEEIQAFLDTAPDTAPGSAQGSKTCSEQVTSEKPVLDENQKSGTTTSDQGEHTPEQGETGGSESHFPSRGVTDKEHPMVRGLEPEGDQVDDEALRKRLSEGWTIGQDGDLIQPEDDDDL